MRRSEWPAVPFRNQHRLAWLCILAIDHITREDPRMPILNASRAFAIYYNGLQLEATRTDVETLAPFAASRNTLQGVVFSGVMQVHGIR